MREERNFVDAALLARYPTIKRTVERARKLGFVFTAHRALFSKRGKVYQHWLYIQSTDNPGTAVEWRHVMYWKKLNVKQKKQDYDKVNQTNNAGTDKD
jgi:uncharacterized membrane protein